MVDDTWMTDSNQVLPEAYIERSLIPNSDRKIMVGLVNTTVNEQKMSDLVRLSGGLSTQAVYATGQLRIHLVPVKKWSWV